MWATPYSRQNRPRTPTAQRWNCSSIALDWDWLEQMRMMGKGALAPCPPIDPESQARWWARYALRTLQEIAESGPRRARPGPHQFQRDVSGRLAANLNNTQPRPISALHHRALALAQRPRRLLGRYGGKQLQI